MIHRPYKINSLLLNYSMAVLLAILLLLLSSEAQSLQPVSSFAPASGRMDRFRSKRNSAIISVPRLLLTPSVPSPIRISQRTQKGLADGLSLSAKPRASDGNEIIIPPEDAQSKSQSRFFKKLPFGSRVRGGGGGGGGRPSSRLLKKRRSSSSPTVLSPHKLFAVDRQIDRTQLKRALLAEFTGTFLMVFLGTGAIMSALFTENLSGLFPIAAVWTIAVTISIACTASISGAHLNPAISLAFCMLRPQPLFGWPQLIPYCISQTLGAAVASACNYILYAGYIRQFEAARQIVRGSSNFFLVQQAGIRTTSGAGGAAAAQSLSSVASAKAFGEYFTTTTAQAFFAEALGTAVLSAVIFALTHPNSDTAKHNVYIPPLIGLTVGALICVLAPLTQAGLNPARDLGPRWVAWAAGWHPRVAFAQSWLYILAPLVGAPIGGWFMDRWLFSTTTTTTT